MSIDAWSVAVWTHRDMQTSCNSIPMQRLHTRCNWGEPVAVGNQWGSVALCISQSDDPVMRLRSTCPRLLPQQWSAEKRFRGSCYRWTTNETGTDNYELKLAANEEESCNRPIVSWVEHVNKRSYIAKNNLNTFSIREYLNYTLAVKYKSPTTWNQWSAMVHLWDNGVSWRNICITIPWPRYMSEEPFRRTSARPRASLRLSKADWHCSLITLIIWYVEEMPWSAHHWGKKGKQHCRNASAGCFLRT